MDLEDPFCSLKDCIMLSIWFQFYAIQLSSTLHPVVTAAL